MTYLTISILLF